MKLSENWLRQWVNPTISAVQMGEQLTSLGLELDELAKLAQDFSGVVIGQVLSLDPHPDADRLRVAMVDIGQGEPLQIVCGASNVAVGIKVPVACVGAVLPARGDGKPFVIKKGKLRGVQSHGMLCGGSEIDADDGVDGLLILPFDAPIGVNVRDYLGLDEHILDISITPNRGDCFSVRGIARELAVINDLSFDLPFSLQDIAPDSDERQAVVVEDKGCPRYIAQVICNVSASTPSPDFIQKALNASGIKSRNFLVDITNFVLMELGQPMHAFDKNKIRGKITVRLANQGESLTLLNEQNITLTGDELVICDDEGVIALAGIMGGLRTAVSDETTDIVLESAFFDPLAIAGRARRFGLHTDASQRFERGVDYDLPQLAINRAVCLLTEHSPTPPTLGAKTVVENTDLLPKRLPICLPIAKIHQVLGVDIGIANVIDILNKLQISTEQQGEMLIATPPSHRYDITIAEDLIEEIGRIYGYDNIANQLPKFAVKLSEDISHQTKDKLKNKLANLGYFEAISFSFSDDKIEKLFDDVSLPTPLALANPISSDLAVMRRTLLSSLLPCVAYNVKRQASSVRLFEMGRRFLGSNAQQLSQIDTLTLVATGAKHDDDPYGDGAMDFFDLKADFESLLPAFALKNLQYHAGSLPFLHAGRSALIDYQGKTIGFLGQLHPKVAKALDLGVVWVGEIDAPALIAINTERHTITAPSKFPQVRRDFAVVVDKAITWGQVSALVAQEAGEFMQACWLFDVYEGDKIGVDKKSLAFALIWQDSNATLTDEYIKAQSDKIIAALEHQLSAKLRD